jgi:hypothetical protein
MDSSKTVAKKQAFVLSPNELRLIHDLFPQAARIVIKITCKDEILRNYKSLEEFLEFENPPQKEITDLFFMALSEDASNTTTVHLRNSEGASIVLILKGQEEYVTTTLSKLEDRLSSMKPWYASIARHSATVVFLLAQVPFIRQLIKTHNSSYTLSNLVSDVSRTPLPQLFLYAILLVILAIIMAFLFNLVDRARKYIFPMGVFAIGQGVNRHQNREILRGLVILGFVINLAAGAVMWFLTAR